MAIPDANMAYLFREAAQQFAPFGSMELVGILLFLIMVYLFWGYGLTMVSGLMLGFLGLSILSLLFGGVFTTVFIVAVVVLGFTVAWMLFSRLARGTA